MKRTVGYIALAIIGLQIGVFALGALGVTTVTVVPVENLAICGKYQRNTDDKTCVVDGDTLWLDGVNIRLKDFDTPEPRTNICGGSTEIELAHAATNRLQELLNSNSWTIETFNMDGTGKRLLATIEIAGDDVGDILIREGLARRWPDGDEFWCR